jgi:hypothetical protein
VSTGQKTAFFFVIGFFAFFGLMEFLNGLGSLLDIRVPGETSPGRHLQIIDGLEGLGFGIAYIMTAIGLYKFLSITRFLAVILLLWNLIGAMSDLSSLYGFSMLIVTIGVGAWLLNPGVRARFSEADSGAKAN